MLVGLETGDLTIDEHVSALLLLHLEETRDACDVFCSSGWVLLHDAVRELFDDWRPPIVVPVPVVVAPVVVP